MRHYFFGLLFDMLSFTGLRLYRCLNEPFSNKAFFAHQLCILHPVLLSVLRFWPLSKDDPGAGGKCQDLRDMSSSVIIKTRNE